MKKKLQKYLSGSNEGFSLVELIIVIAIMAILIGVVALAVIPYLEKSRESKDLQALSTLSGALSTAVADVKAKGSGTITLPIGSPIAKVASPSTDQDKVQNAMADVIGDAKVDLGSNAAVTNGDNQVTCYYDSTKNVVAVFVALKNGATNNGSTTTTAPNGTTSVSNCKYNDNTPLMVSNGGGSGAGGSGGGSGSGTP